MKISDISVRRPVFAAVLGLLLIVFGLLSFSRLPVREYPNIDPPVVSVETGYPGASAAVVETKITQILEERVSGIEGIKWIESKSRDGRSTITIAFSSDRNPDNAANDVRERISRARADLPIEADPPEIYKVDSDNNVIVWFNLSSTVMDERQLTDYAQRNLVDRLAVLDGVARVRVGGEQRYAMRIWLDRVSMAARNLTVKDIEDALRNENIELPAGRVESVDRDFTLRMARAYKEVDDFSNLVVGRGSDGHLIRLGEVARIERGAEEPRSVMRGNNEPMIGLGIIKQSTANTLTVAKNAHREIDRMRANLPAGMTLNNSYDTSAFIKNAINEVYKTLGIAILGVIAVVFLFLGDWRALLIPAATVPVSLIATFMALDILGFSINLLTLLALVLSIGLVVDDSIVVLENIHRRISKGEPPLLAANLGVRQVTFAIIATTLVLISVFVPLAFLEGDIGRLFGELAFTVSAAVAFSTLCALSLSPMLASKLLSDRRTPSRWQQKTETVFAQLSRRYVRALSYGLQRPEWMMVILLACLIAIAWLWRSLPDELVPEEDRGAFFVIMEGPEGAGYDYATRYMKQVEEIMLPLLETGEATRVLVRVPRSFSGTENYSDGIGIIVLASWNERQRSAFEIIDELRQQFKEVPGVKTFAFMRRGIGGRGIGAPVQFVLGGGDDDELTAWRDIVMARAAENPGLVGLNSDYKETKPQFTLSIRRDRAADLGVSIKTIGQALETMMGSRRVTTYIDRGEEYDVILQGRDADRRDPGDLTNLYVRSERSGALIPLSSLVTIHEEATARERNRYNRLQAITISANLAPGYSLGEALDFLNTVVDDALPDTAQIDYKGESLEFERSESESWFIFLMALAIVYLTLAAQFESFLHPLSIMPSVPVAILGGLAGLYITQGTLNIYSQIGLLILIGLAAKNSILIVEFANQLRDSGMKARPALLEAAHIRFRPIIMTSLSTMIGALPLVVAYGAGSESRISIGIVVTCGAFLATITALFVAPLLYDLLAPYTQPPQATSRRLDSMIKAIGSNKAKKNAPR